VVFIEGMKAKIGSTGRKNGVHIEDEIHICSAARKSSVHPKEPPISIN
jgi:hypothetical protein